MADYPLRGECEKRFVRNETATDNITKPDGGSLSKLHEKVEGVKKCLGAKVSLRMFCWIMGVLQVIALTAITAGFSYTYAVADDQREFITENRMDKELDEQEEDLEEKIQRIEVQMQVWRQEQAVSQRQILDAVKELKE